MKFNLTYKILIVLLLSFQGFSQIRRGDALRNRIDSLNKVAFDHPLPVLKMADSLSGLALRKKRPIDYGLLLQVKGVAKTSLGANSEALALHMKSYRVFDSIGNNEGKIFALINISTVYMNFENIPKSREYLLKALTLTQKKDYNLLKTIYVNLGVSYTYEDDFSKAIAYYLNAIPYLEHENDHNGLAVNYHNIAACYNEMKDLANAEAYELRALEHYRKSGSKSTLAMISLELGELYTQSRQLEKARKYLEIGGKAAHELNSPYYRDTYYEYLAQWFKVSGNYKESAAYLEKLVALRDTIHSDEAMQNNATLEQQFQSSLQAKEIELLKVQKKLSQSQMERTHFWRVVFSLISVLCLVIIVVLFRNFKLKQKANRLLKQEKNELAEQNLRLENENILVQFETLKNQVSPHFLFNSLNALASLIGTDPKKAIAFTNAFSKIFRNALELKDRPLVALSDELQHVNAYLALQQIRFGDNLRVNITVPSDRMKEYLPPFSLQMVIENAIKHNRISSDDPLEIAITAKDGFVVVTNNLQMRQFVEDSTGTGIANIRSRYKYVTSAEPVFEIRNQQYYVELPLITEE